MSVKSSIGCPGTEILAAGWGVVNGSRIRREYPVMPGRLEYRKPNPWSQPLNSEPMNERVRRARGDVDRYDPSGVAH